MFYCKYGNHTVYKDTLLDEDISIAINESICQFCAEKFWKEYEEALAEAWEKSLEQFSTTGWVTCAICRKTITEGLQEGKLGQKHYCYEHFGKERS